MGAALIGWAGDWAGRKIAVLGLGATGFSAADTLTELGAEVLVVARDASDERQELAALVGARYAETADDGMAAALADFGPEAVVVSPGIPPEHPAVVWARGAGTPVWGDLDLAWRLRDKSGPQQWVLVTGARSGAVAELAASMLAAAGVKAAPAGREVSVLDAIRDPTGFPVLVIEATGRQLHWLVAGDATNDETLVSPVASVCLDLAPDPAEPWHGSADAVRAAKGKAYANTSVACVYNTADVAVRELVEQADVLEGARAIGYGLGVPGRSDFGIVEGLLVDRAFLDDRQNRALEIMTVDELLDAGLTSPHDAVDVLAAAALARAVGADVDAVREGALAYASRR